MSGQDNRGSDKTRTRTLWKASILSSALAALSVLLGSGIADVLRGRGVFDIRGPLGPLGAMGLFLGWVLGLTVLVLGWRFLGEYLLDNVQRDGRPTRAAVAVLVVGVVASVGGFAAAYVTAPPEPRCPQVANQDIGFGTAVTYDGFEYVLTAVDNNPPAGGEGASGAPLGEWFVVHGTVTNIDYHQRQFTGTVMALMVCYTHYSPDTGLSTPPMELNPGLTAEIVLVYDVPAGFPFGDAAGIRIGSVYVPWDGSESAQ